MTLDEIKQAIITHFLTEWALLSSPPVVTIQNEDFDPATEGGTEWVRISINEEDTRQRSLGRPGTRKFERLGRVFVQVFVKQGEGGTQRADEIGQDVRDILEGTDQITGACFFTGRVLPAAPDGYWYRVVADVEFSYDETK